MPTRSLNALAVVAALTLPAARSSAQAAGQLADLRWRPQPGQSVRYELHQTSENARVDTPVPSPSRGKPAQPAQSVRSSTVESKLDQTLILRFDVPEPDLGADPAPAPARGRPGTPATTTVTMTVERVRMKIESDAVNIEIDSGTDAPNADPVAQAVRSMSGAVLTLTVDADGRIIKSEGGGAALGLSSLLTGIDPAAAGALPSDALGLITPGGAPPKSARVGQRWTSTSTLGGSLLGDVSITTTHALKRLVRAVAEVETQGSMTPTRPPSERGRVKPDEPAPMFHVTSASNNGGYRWDTEIGWLESLTSVQTVRMETELLGESRVMESTLQTRLKRLENGSEQPQRPR